MEYLLRCNRFRENIENFKHPHQNYKDIRNSIQNGNFQHACYQIKSVVVSPQKPKPLDHSKIVNPAFYLSKKQTLDYESDKSTYRTQITFSTELNYRRSDQSAFASKQRMNISLSDVSSTAKRRKSHFLTVVSRLPGMSKSKKKINFS